MVIDYTKGPFPVTYRELWLPRGINNNSTLPTSRWNGHGLALTGARKGTTANGVHFDGSVTSNINCGEIHNASAKLWVSFRFKLDADFVIGTTTIITFGKFEDGFTNLYLYLHSVTGKLTLDQNMGLIHLESNEVSWEAGKSYHVIASISDSGGGRLIVDGGVAITAGGTANLPNGADLVFGDKWSPGTGGGFEGIISDVFVGTDDLTTDEETDLYNGIPPLDTVNEYLLDEGRGVIAYDRGSGGNNGTLGTSATWAWGMVQQPVLSLDGINDYGATGAGVDISGDLTVVWAGKMKSTYSALTSDHYLFSLYTNGDNRLMLFYNNPAQDYLDFYTEGSGDTVEIPYTGKPVIDDYLIITGTIRGAVSSLFINGSLVGTSTGVGARVGLATAYIGASQTLGFYDISKPLMIGLIDGAFTAAQSKAYSRWIKDIFNLPIII